MADTEQPQTEKQQPQKVKLVMGIDQETKKQRQCCETLVGCLLPPVFLCMAGHKQGGTIILNIILTILLIVPGIIHAFVVDGIPCCACCLCVFLPPVGLYCSTKKVDFNLIICIL